MNYILIGLGGWLIFDGIASIIKYKKQSLGEQVIRVIRTAIGLTVVVLGGIG